MSAAMAATVPAATGEASSRRSAAEPAADRAMRESARSARHGAGPKSTASFEPASAIESAPAIEPAAPDEAAPAVKAPAAEAMEPRTRSDKHAAREPARSIIAIRRASVRRIRVVAVGANRRRAKIGRPNSHADHNSLCTSQCCRSQENAKYRENS